MQSPFEIFRKHQKMLTVVLTGLAMFAFVILGAVPDPSAMPPLLGAIFIGGVVGGLAWLAGIRSKKSNEWGLVGFIAGLGIGLAAMMAVGPGDVVRADTGNIDQMEMSNLVRQRGLANQFVGMAYARAQENGFQAFSAPFRFSFGHPDETRDIVVGELLRREADRLGMEVTDEAVNDFIRTEFDGKIGASDVREIRRQIGISESEVYTAMRNELKAFNAGRFFYGGITVANGRNPLPPLEYWEFYRRMNIQQTVGVVPLPVSAFVDEGAQPGDSELQELFVRHKGNFPNTTLEGRLEEGLIGFRQPRRIALEYIEIPYEAVEKTIGEVTDEEIEQYYEEFYASAPDLPMSGTEGAAPTDGPALPDLTPDEAPQTDDKPEMKAPAETSGEEKPVEDKPADEPPAEPKPESPAPATEEDKPAETPQPSTDDAKPETPETPAEQPNADEPPAESESETPSEPQSDESGADADESGASLRSRSALQLVAFFDDEQSSEQPAETPADTPAESEDAPADEKPATGNAADQTPPEQKPANETPADEKPADTPAKPEAGDKPDSDAADQPAGDAPASEKEMPAEPAAPAEGGASAETPATPPTEPAGPRELDDELREEIRDQILRRKTSQKQQELMRQTFELMGIELSTAMILPEEEEGHISAEAATQKLKEFAQQNGLVYDRTPLMSLRELEQSEEHPVGRASSVANTQSVESAAQIAFSMPPSSLFQTRQVMDIETGSRFVFWKIEDVASYVPESLEDPGIREQVVETWRQLQAREKARARAQELASQAEGVDTPLSEVFAGATVTGKEGDDAISVVQPPKFSWLSAPSAEMSPNPFNRPTPTLTELRTVPGDVGEEFMRTVFDQLDPGEAGVAHSFDMQYFYVVKVIDRSYGNAPDQQAFRERFTSQPVFDQFGFSDYFKLAARELAQYQTNWADELFRRHNVVFAETSPQDGEES